MQVYGESLRRRAVRGGTRLGMGRVAECGVHTAASDRRRFCQRECEFGPCGQRGQRRSATGHQRERERDGSEAARLERSATRVGAAASPRHSRPPRHGARRGARAARTRSGVVRVLVREPCVSDDQRLMTVLHSEHVFCIGITTTTRSRPLGQGSYGAKQNFKILK